VTIYRKQGKQIEAIQIPVAPTIDKEGLLTDGAIHPSALAQINEIDTTEERIQLVNLTTEATGDRLQELYRLLNSGQRLSFILAVERQF
jgi:hypothetical protein